MEPIYRQEFTVTDNCVNCFGRLKSSMVLYYMQEVAGKHFDAISMSYEELASRGLLWAIIRQKVAITRLPRLGEKFQVETWPMPSTRVAFPRSVVARDMEGNELFRAISLWVLMDRNTRAMVLPGKSGIDVPGTLMGNELAAPAGLPARVLANRRSRQVSFTDLDRNGHMNNTRYLDWIDDLLPSSFHGSCSPREMTICYLSEALEGQTLEMAWEMDAEGCMQVEALRPNGEKSERIFAARLLF